MESHESETVTVIISEPLALDLNTENGDEQDLSDVKSGSPVTSKDSLQAVVDECIIPDMLTDEVEEDSEIYSMGTSTTGDEIIVICAVDDQLESIITEEAQNMENMSQQCQLDEVPVVNAAPRRRRRKGPRKTRKLSNELRKKIIELVISKGYSFSRTGRDLNVCRGTIASVVRTYRLENRTEKIRSNGRKGMFTPEQEALLVEYMKGKEDATVRKIGNYISDNPHLFPGVSYVSKTTLYKILNKNQCLRKYSDKVQDIRNDDTILEARKAYVTSLYPLGCTDCIEKHVYIDVVGFKLSLLNRSKHAVLGERVTSRNSTSRGGSVSFCLAMSIHGIHLSKFQLRPFGISEFLTCLQELCEDLPEELTLILDDAEFNHDEAITKYLDLKKHTVLYIPNHSEFLNPIMNAAFKVRTALRDKEMDDRYAIVKALEDQVDGITKESCEEWVIATKQYHEACASLTPIIASQSLSD